MTTKFDPDEEEDFNLGQRPKVGVDWDEEPGEDDHFKINPEKKRQPTTEEYIERYGFGVE